MSYTSQANIESYLKRDLTSEEGALLPLILSAVDEYLDDALGGSYGIVSASTRYYDGCDVSILNVDPCKDITAVKHVDWDESVLTEYVLNEDFESHPRNETIKRWIERRNYPFPAGVSNIAVTAKFTLGDTVPDDLEYLATYLACQLIGSQLRGNLKSESIEGYSRTFADMVEGNEVVNLILNKYIKSDILI